MDAPLPPLSPINDNTLGSGNEPVARSGSSSSPNAFAATVADEFFQSVFSDSSGAVLTEVIEGSPDVAGTSVLHSPRILFGSPDTGAEFEEVGEENNAFASGVSFPTEQPILENLFFNQQENLNDDGYDSEGNLPHFADTENDDMEDYDEAPIAPIATPAPVPVALVTVEAVEKLSVKELKDELRKRGRSITGKKGELAARLVEAVAANVPVLSSDDAPRHESMAGVDVGAEWVLLTSNAVPVPEPENADSSHRPPTERDGIVTPKYGFVETFDRMPFTGTTEKMRYTRPKGASSNRKNRDKRRKISPTRHARPSAAIEPRVLGGPNNDFLKRYGLDENSHPMDWFVAFMPLTADMNKEDPAKANVKGDGVSSFAISNWTQYSNTKAMIVGAGKKGCIFSGKFKPFKDEEILRMLGVYIIDGLAPSHQLVQKMQPQSKQPTHGNDKIAQAIGPGYQQLHRSFRHFFAVQDPLMNAPPKDKCPNFKVDELFRWCRYIWKEAWCLGKEFSVDEQTCKMQGRSEYKTRCGKYKRLGDGIQTDCIADDGYTFDFYFRNEPVSASLLAEGLCPMHCRLVHMFGNLCESGHGCKMDNLFNSVRLAQAAYSLEKPVLIHGVLRKSGRGCPPCVFQDEKTGKAAELAKGTVKAAVLRGDSRSSNLVVASCYDQKPFYMISHSCESVTWTTCERMVYSSSLRATVPFKFLRWNLSDDYNFEMNDNDIADQLRLVYRFMRFQRNNKWWWALFLWAYEVSMVNSYVAMKRYCELKGVPMKWTHHDWNEAIGYAHLDPQMEWLQRKSPGKSTANDDTAGATSNATSEAKQRNARIDTMALSPIRGRMNVRLDHTNFRHVPIKQTGRGVCQLHRWAAKEDGGDKEKNNKPAGSRGNHVAFCEACQVNICIPCWKLYHFEHDLKPHIQAILSKK